MAEHKVVCPFCHKGEVYAEGSGNVAVTVMCPKCTRCFRVRLDVFTAEVVVPRKKINKMIVTYRTTDRTHQR